MSSFSQSEVPVVSGLVAAEPGRSSRLFSYRTVGLLIAVCDFIAIVVASVATGIAYHILLGTGVGDIAAFIGVGNYSALVFILLTKSRGLYQATALLSPARQFRGVILGWFVVLVAIASLLFLLKISDSYSRGTTIGFGILGLALLLGSRAVIASKLSQALANGSLAAQRAVVIGDRTELAAFSADDFLKKYGTREACRFELSEAADDADTFGQDDLATIEKAADAAQADDIEEFLVALRWTNTVRREIVCERLRALPLPVFLLPDRSVGPILSQPTIKFGSQIAIELQRAPLSRLELAQKRALDLLVVAASLAIFWPLLTLIAIAIKLDSRGPIIFRQRRKGFNGREFRICKFRTMKVLEDGQEIRQAKRNDSRVTRIGRLLRATSIDELPQLINVLRGDMSVVGPRPHAVAHDDEYAKSIANYAHRHHVRPGITGWAQVNGFRGETAELGLMKQRIDHDLWYINNWSLWIDLQILFQTTIEIARRKNAF